MKKIKIEVTEQDISAGLKTFGKGGASYLCPVARAAQRALKDKKAWSGVAVIASNGKFHDLPKAATDFVTRFDLQKPVKPFSFTINLPA